MPLILVKQTEGLENGAPIGGGEVAAGEGREERICEVERPILSGHPRLLTEVCQIFLA